VVRLDDSDCQVFDTAAEPDEWAVPGGFEFLHLDPGELEGKRAQAFASGFLGIGSYGRATLVRIDELADEEYQSVVERLADHLQERYGAPDRNAALVAAAEEVAYAESLCEYDNHTLLALERRFEDSGVSEAFKRFLPSAGADWEQGKPLVFKKEP
jgi:hypothetical protein